METKFCSVANEQTSDQFDEKSFNLKALKSSAAFKAERGNVRSFLPLPLEGGDDKVRAASKHLIGGNWIE